MVPPDAIHRVGDPHVVLDELEGDVLVGRVMFGQDHRDLEHALAIERHPRGAVRLLERSPGRQRRAAIEDADVVEAEEAAGEDVPAGGILAVDPPVEVQHQALERSLEEAHVGAAQRPFHAIEIPQPAGVFKLTRLS